ncbi:MarR family transcriptional regulator [Kitasatospora sp. NPDC006697]|uniref:GbsR/MarR family transcriptional regulator n=1 Tax=Kitasatospora sp. NPDC006697 TaxID=3364020 RepID=UPI003673EABB
MPGARLTRRERGRIAAGLAGGLGYGEIARALGRSTSTVSREIARNGGPAGYRADRAHWAAERRLHRAPVRRPAGRRPGGGGDGRDREAVGRFADGLGELLTRLGLPRPVARVLSCLYTTDSGCLTAAELDERLRVSPAAVARAVGYLERQQLVRRERAGQRRRERYRIADDVWYRALLASAQRNVELAEAARGGGRLLGPGSPAGARMDGAADFLERIGRELVRAVELWRLGAAGNAAVAVAGGDRDS